MAFSPVLDNTLSEIFRLIQGSQLNVVSLLIIDPVDWSSKPILRTLINEQSDRNVSERDKSEHISILRTLAFSPVGNRFSEPKYLHNLSGQRFDSGDLGKFGSKNWFVRFDELGTNELLFGLLSGTPNSISYADFILYFFSAIRLSLGRTLAKNRSSFF